MVIILATVGAEEDQEPSLLMVSELLVRSFVQLTVAELQVLGALTEAVIFGV
jgi:hypothetical protein